ncbi:Hemerythrin HHE cation binding domain-containing protein [Amycolatopsis arida]|uniref:Hemerythrin HHE cation binding domain-containing protein n=1 Tax=Amycolatopsis arida TaxID=587909 RepID=A0A1I5TVW0_9PSEU|nr:hemerythrin domain-containing protein [Amycolatopsis arida]TDX95970.1 hemerythrin HHE cation binding domain-containing protein [Amycolatopsis arida]SFP86456.1 Hemerythrin HHE cation binding domain-containing protein [Amycolatopsis arida]
MGDDVVEMILADHRTFGKLMRDLRDAAADRAALRAELAALLVAHAEAEEDEVYPTLRADAATEHEVDHGEEEHAEINQALLAFLEVEDLTGRAYEDALAELVRVVEHHTDEEEQTLLSDARTTLPAVERERLGLAFRRSRRAHLDAGCGRIDNVRRLAEHTAGRIG